MIQRRGEKKFDPFRVGEILVRRSRGFHPRLMILFPFREQIAWLARQSTESDFKLRHYPTAIDLDNAAKTC